ncbi:MAG: hypothetical protein NSGCLCUN01_03753 [uncultured Clostridium sp.]
MREIKFRAFSKRLNKMLTSVIIKQSSDSLVKIINEIMPGLDCKKGIFIPTEDTDLKIIQYTGLKDKNGKEIYEGDIIQFVWSEDSCWGEAGTYKGYITFGKGAFEVEYIDREEKMTYCDEDGLHEKNKSDYVGPLFSWSDEVEVIGNIYENPELLEGNQYESTTDNK